MGPKFIDITYIGLFGAPGFFSETEVLVSPTRKPQGPYTRSSWDFYGAGATIRVWGFGLRVKNDLT